MRPAERRHHPARYQGKNLAYLLLAICFPAGLLFLRLLFGVAATDTRITPRQSAWFGGLSYVALALFFLAQLICARYLQRLLRPRSSLPGKSLQYVLVLLMGLVFSLTGAIMLESFGLNLFLRAAGPPR